LGKHGGWEEAPEGGEEMLEEVHGGTARPPVDNHLRRRMVR
jgi:hypothetical protein